LSKKIKEALVEKYGGKCFIYIEKMDERELQIDHRVPYEVGGNGNGNGNGDGDGESGELNPEDFMLLSGSANRAKSWSCEHCENWNNIKDRTICLTCYWAYPENCDHIAMHQLRRIDLVWQGDEIEIYEKLKEKAGSLKKEIPLFVKEILEKEVCRKRT
jgi:hypothetical protein